MWKTYDLEALLSENDYPGRGIVLGRSPDGTKAVMVYFIMGRSVNSRNRVFLLTEDGIRTEAFDPAKLSDPSLIIYHPVRVWGNWTIVSNGDQTDTIRDFMCVGKTMEAALKTRTFEPDGPNFTPRISGVVRADGTYKLSILKSLDGDPSCCVRQYFDYDHPAAGVGHFIHTYMMDGEPLPSFEGEPERVDIDCENAKDLADRVWAALNEENKVSLFVRYHDIETGEDDTVIINKNEN